MINFSQPVYSIDENNGAVEIQLLFSNPSSTAIAIEVTSEEINATGKSMMHSHTDAYCACRSAVHVLKTKVILIFYRKF